MSIHQENRPNRPKIDLGQTSLFPVATVSQNLQDRLGLAKVKYERTHSNGIGQKPGNGRKRKSFHTGSDIMSDPTSTSDIVDSRYETPFPSSPLPASSFSKEFPRSARTHTSTFQPESVHSAGRGSRKRTRSDSTTDGPSKIARTSWKRSHQLPESSPSGGHRLAMYHGRSASFAPRVGSTSRDFQFPPFPNRPDKDNDPDLPANDIPIISSSMASSSPPRTPPPHHAVLPRNGKGVQKGEDGADLLLYLANSPTPANIAPKNLHRDFLPSTPPSQHAALASLTQTPQFNFADFVNVTPSPAQRTWGGRTPGGAAKTPLATKEMRKRLNFDTLAPPIAGSPARSRDKDPKPVLQLGEELRP